MSTLAVTNIQSQSSGTLPSFQDSGGVERGRMCVAFVNFNGTTSPGTIRSSFNVSSVTKNGTGDYTINFTNALVDGNYSVAGIVGPNVGVSRFGCLTSYPNDSGVISYLTTSVRLGCASGGPGNPTAGNTMFDSAYISVSIFR
jgi:hypothetical protein